METAIAINTIWVLIATALVFFMHAGFAMVEVGFTQAKNASNIIMKNLMTVSVGTIVFWLAGFGIMFGVDNKGLIGQMSVFSDGVFGHLGLEIPVFAFFIFQTVFCATAATIVSGAVAERTKYSAYIIFSLVISLVIYPVVGHWIWGGGWLSQLGFHDFAGSTVVHTVGGLCAFVGAYIIGPRIGKYSKTGKSKAIPGHSITLGALGVFILWFGWFGFNPGSTLSGMDYESISKIFVTTNMSAAAGAMVTMFYTWIRYKKPDVSMTLNGALAGLVAITAGTDSVSPFGALMIGAMAGILIVHGIEFVDQVLKVDDPVGAVGVHGICGIYGTLMVGFFSETGGFFYGFDTTLLTIQLVGVLAVSTWTLTTAFVVFKIVDAAIGLRVDEKHEHGGLDINEHGIETYADFSLR